MIFNQSSKSFHCFLRDAGVCGHEVSCLEKNLKREDLVSISVLVRFKEEIQYRVTERPQKNRQEVKS